AQATFGSEIFARLSRSFSKLYLERKSKKLAVIGEILHSDTRSAHALNLVPQPIGGDLRRRLRPLFTSLERSKARYRQLRQNWLAQSPRKGGRIETISRVRRLPQASSQQRRCSRQRGAQTLLRPHSPRYPVS